MQLVYVHRFSSATNVSRVVARVAEGGFYFNPSSNVAFNVTAIVRRADLHILFQLLRVLQRIRQGWSGHSRIQLCITLLNLYPSGCHRQHGFAFPRFVHPHTHVRHRGPHQLPSCLHGKRDQCTAHCVRHQQRLVGGLRSEDHVRALHTCRTGESSIVGARLHNCFSGTALHSS